MTSRGVAEGPRETRVRLDQGLLGDRTCRDRSDFAKTVRAAIWLSDKVAEDRALLGEQEGLGRRRFLAGPIEHARPSWGPSFARAATRPRFRSTEVPGHGGPREEVPGTELMDHCTSSWGRGAEQLGEASGLEATISRSDTGESEEAGILRRRSNSRSL